MVDWAVVNWTINILGGLAAGGLGVFLLLAARGRPAKAFGAFAALWGTANALTNSAHWYYMRASVFERFDPLWWVDVFGGLFWWIACGCLVWFALIHPVPHLTRRWGYWIGGAFAAYAFAYPLLEWPGSGHMFEWFIDVANVWWLGAAATFGAWLHIARYENAGASDRHELIIMAFAFAVYTLYRAAGALNALTVLRWSADPFGMASMLFVVVLVLALVVGWAHVWQRTGDRGPRNMMLLTLLVVVAGQLAFMLSSVHGMPEFGAYGLLRLLMVATVAYGILRHQFFGLELKVRWGISRSTLAAVFVGVFLLVSTVVSEYLLDAYGYLAGGLAVGALLFGLAPLRRWADGIAEKAVPISATSAEHIYLAAVQAALRDGTLTRREERHLMEVADGLAISAARAMDLLDGARGA